MVEQTIATVDVPASGLVFETLVAGPADGEPVILLHGYPQSAAAWQETLRWLAGRGMRALAPNLRGYSPRANPQDASAYTMDQLVADVIGIADAQDVERFHLVGHDWGGALAWAIATAHPRRLISLTVLSTPHMVAFAEAVRTSSQALRSYYAAFFRIPRLPEAVLSAGDYFQLGLSCRLTGLPRAAWERDRAQLRRVGLHGALNWYRAAAKLSGRMRRVNVPTLYIWGRHDPFLGRRAAELTAKYVTGEYRFVELDAGHWITERNTDQFRELLAEHLAAHRLARAAPRAASVATKPAGATATRTTGTAARSKPTTGKSAGTKPATKRRSARRPRDT